jgi:hypothetical protein
MSFLIRVLATFQVLLTITLAASCVAYPSGHYADGGHLDHYVRNSI